MRIEKTPLILIPALMTDKRLYAHQIQHLEDVADISIADISRHDNASEIAAGILEKAPEQFALAGVSMGGFIALEIIRQAPHRVMKLALINTKAGLDTPELLERRKNAVASVKPENFKEFMTNAVSKYVKKENNVDNKLTDLLVDMAMDLGIEAYKNQQTTAINRIDSTDFLKDIQVKTMIVCGREDALLDDMKEIHAQIPLSRFSIIEDCAHLSPIEQPVALTALMRYWLS